MTAPLPQTPEPGQRWRTIESAPPGERLTLGWQDASWPDGWARAIGEASWTWRHAGREGVSRHHRATHWMPLPAPPEPAS